MGRKKPFIDKQKATTFQVVHRSIQDAAGEYDKSASSHVLVESRPNKNQARAQRQSELRLTDNCNHINELGLPNDGYDYSAHMKQGGGGIFVGRDGGIKAATALGAGSGGTIALPQEVLPSEEVLERELECITISDKVMDRDMAAIVRGEDDEFEELDDDFLAQAAEELDDGESDAIGFDFKAHMARLMAASEDETHVNVSGRRRRAPWLEEEEDEEDEEDDDEGEDFDVAALGLELQGERGGAAVQPHATSEEHALCEAMFEAALAEYDSEEWGEGLEEEEESGEEDATGEGVGFEDKHVEEVLNEFLNEQAGISWKDNELENPLAVVGKDQAAPGEREEGEQPAVTAGQALLYRIQMEREAEAAEADEDTFTPMDPSFEYFKPREVERWDCQTIVSTYSNLDNRPEVIALKRNKPKKERPRPLPPAAVEGSRKIELSQKTGLPIGVISYPAASSQHSVQEEADASSKCNHGVRRDRAETKEEKKDRKERLKEEKRKRRQRKKASKQEFVAATMEVTKVLANAETANARSVFRY